MITFIYDHKKEKVIWNSNQGLYDANQAKDIGLTISTHPSPLVVETVVGALTYFWRETEQKFLRKLGAFYNKKLEPANLEARLVRLPRLPYHYKGDDQWFAVPLYAQEEEQMRVVMRELCHFYQPISLPRPVKEAIPTILNHMAFPISFDKGHSDDKEQEWRLKIAKLYEDKKTIYDLSVKEVNEVD